MSTKQESGDDHDELDVESAIGDENINPDVFSIRNALEQPDARVYTTLDLHSKPFTCQRLAEIIERSRAVQIHNGKIDLNPPYQRGVVL